MFEKNQVEFLYKEIENNKKQIIELKNKLIDIEKKIKDEIIKKDKIINDLVKRLEKFENLLTTNKTKDIKTKNPNDFEQKNNKIEKIITKLYLKEIKKERKIIKTSKPVNEICYLQKSESFIETSGPKLFDNNFNLIMSFDNIGFCEHSLSVSSAIIVMG